VSWWRRGLAATTPLVAVMAGSGGVDSSGGGDGRICTPGLAARRRRSTGARGEAESGVKSERVNELARVSHVFCPVA